jgi:hypothetical protein
MKFHSHLNHKISIPWGKSRCGTEKHARNRCGSNLIPNCVPQSFNDIYRPRRFHFLLWLMFPKEISKRLWLELECTECTGFWSFHHMMISNQQWCLTPHPPFPKCLSGDNTLWNILCTKTPKTQHVLICTQVPHSVSRAFRMAGIVPDLLPHFHW